MTSKILLADDNELTRRVIRFVLCQRADLEVSAEAVDGEEAVQMAKLQCPDLAILDISMPRKNGIQAAKEIVAFCPQTIVLTDSLHDVGMLVEQLQKAGVKGFVSKYNLATDLIPAIETVLRGGTSFHPDRWQTA